ncbi:MAG: DUF3109 family protein [Bacteroidetes bacterium]|nr:MAG: DUF3109 family protein [Bacteroidota bacterium]
MLIEVEDKVVSLEILEKKFVCDLGACKGICCIEGDSGAPLEPHEIDLIEEDLEQIESYMRPEGIEAIREQGVFYMDWDNEPVTTLVNNKECAFVFFDEKGITKCAIEQAHREGKSKLLKPISCHLYPIREKRYPKFKALQYDKWDICRPACACGEELEVPVYRFLKEPIIRAYGLSFYEELEKIDRELKKRGLEKEESEGN